MNDRLGLIKKLEFEISKITTSDTFAELSYLDVIQALTNQLNSCIRWHRKTKGYRKLNAR